MGDNQLSLWSRVTVKTCKFCGDMGDAFEKDSDHERSQRHLYNKKLKVARKIKKSLCANRDGVNVSCSVFVNGLVRENLLDSTEPKISVKILPTDKVEFKFRIESIRNKTKNEAIKILNVELMHPQKQFALAAHPFTLENEPYTLLPKTSIDAVAVVFETTHETASLGSLIVPICFYFSYKKKSTANAREIIIRDLEVCVESRSIAKEEFEDSPYKDEEIKANLLLPCTITGFPQYHMIPKDKKKILKNNLSIDKHTPPEARKLALTMRCTIDEGPKQENYKEFFSHLLWWEETISKLRLKKFNMHHVILTPVADTTFRLFVPGLTEKRPPLTQGGRVLVVPDDGRSDFMFEGLIKDINDDSSIYIHGFNNHIHQYCSVGVKFKVRFLHARVTHERMHEAVGAVGHQHAARVHPTRNARIVHVRPVAKFYNPLVERNPEQRAAVEHILANTSGKAPYMVFGPPGTGKTITIVEAILQVVLQNSDHRVLVCTDSNMAADHIAESLLKYREHLPVSNFLVRVNSRHRDWETLPVELRRYCNGACKRSFYPVTNENLTKFRIVVSTLMHSAKYGNSQARRKVVMSHVFVDEAAQALEPAALVPVAALLAPAGQLVLAGDPHQLGPVVASRQAAKFGLGMSLMERLKKEYPELYGTGDNQYITMLKENYRSHPDILEIPNALFYHNELRYCVAPDPLSEVDILANGKTGRAMVFHAVNSKNQRVGKSPSFFNTWEMLVLELYVEALVKHGVRASDIGVVTPYKRQMFKVMAMLNASYPDVEVGTVEAFQGQQKRVIIISTVRGEAEAFTADYKFQLGFVRDPKRFNVAITRAKAKVIVIGNPCCLKTDPECWGRYMDKCKELGTYFGLEQEERRLETHEAMAKAINDFGLMKINDDDEDKNDKNKKAKKPLLTH